MDFQIWKLFDYSLAVASLILVIAFGLRFLMWYMKPVREEEIKTKIRQREFLDGLERHEDRRQELCDKHADAVSRLSQGVLVCQPIVKGTNENTCAMREAAAVYAQLLRVELNTEEDPEVRRRKMEMLLDEMESRLIRGTVQ